MDANPTNPFPFLKLPLDLRFVVYDFALGVTTKHCRPHIEKLLQEDPKEFEDTNDASTKIVLVVKSIPGIQLLATCRQINTEMQSMANKKLERLMREPARLFMQLPRVFSQSKECEFLHALISQDPVMVYNIPTFDRDGYISILSGAFPTVYDLYEGYFYKFNNFFGHLLLNWRIKVDPPTRAWLWKIFVHQDRFQYIDDHGILIDECPDLIKHETTHYPLIEMRLLHHPPVRVVPHPRVRMYETWGRFMLPLVFNDPNPFMMMHRKDQQYVSSHGVDSNGHPAGNFERGMFVIADELGEDEWLENWEDDAYKGAQKVRSVEDLINQVNPESSSHP